MLRFGNSSTGHLVRPTGLSAALSAFTHDLLVNARLARVVPQHSGQRIAGARLDGGNYVEVGRALSCWHSFSFVCAAGGWPHSNFTVSLLRPHRIGVNGTKTVLWHEAQHDRHGWIVTEVLLLRDQQFRERELPIRHAKRPVPHRINVRDDLERGQPGARRCPVNGTAWFA